MHVVVLFLYGDYTTNADHGDYTTNADHGDYTTNADHDLTYEHKLTKKTQLING